MANYVAEGYVTPGYFQTGISIDWDDAIIYVPKSFMVLTQTSPTEVYQLDMNEFRLALKDLEDSEIGMPWPTTHNHNQPVTVSGAVLARVVEILEPYTVTFEDGQYRVNVVGANTNIGERSNVNNVSISTSNSAGLQDLNSLQAASFGGEVTLEISSQYTGTVYPIGTGSQPVNNLADALAIADSRGIRKIKIKESMTLSGEDFSEGYEFEGVSAASAVVTIDPSTEVSRCTFRNLTVQGTLDNGNILRECNILDLTDVDGFIFQCALSGTITLGGGTQTAILDCFSGVAGGGIGQFATIDFNGANGNDLILRNYSGGISFQNCSNPSLDCSVDMSSGRIVVENTVTEGSFTLRGIAEVTDNSTGNAVIANKTFGDVSSLQIGSFLGSVYVDPANGTAGTVFPQGTPSNPVNNLTDALTILNSRGLAGFQFIGFNNISEDLSAGYDLLGENASGTFMNFLPGSDVSNCRVNSGRINGTLGADMILNGCSLFDVTYTGTTSINDSALVNVQTLGNTGQLLLNNCYAALEPDPPYVPTIDAGSGMTLIAHRYSGYLKIINKTGPETFTLHVDSGVIEIDPTCTGGSIVIRGNCEVIDTSNGVIVDTGANDSSDVNSILSKVNLMLKLLLSK